MAKVLGIDLGTTNSVVAIMNRGEPEIIINEEGGRTTPSVVALQEDGERLVGQIAKRQLVLNPSTTIHSVKRFMGRSMEEAADDLALVGYDIDATNSGECGISVRQRHYSPQEISAMILQKLRHSAEEFLGETVTDAVITVPAYFTDRQRQATRDAGVIAGLNVLRIVNEPTAAALVYLHGQDHHSTIAVYDFGGGTFDISILEVARDVADVRGTRGNHALGGADIDWRIVEWLIEQFQAEHGIDISEDRAVLQRLRDAAERTKIELSATLESEIHLPFLVADESGPKHLQVTLTRSTFEGLVNDLLEQTIEECRVCMEESGVSADDIDEIIMVGGSSRIPAIQERVQSIFKRPMNKAFNPDEVVAMGAAIQGGILEGDVKAVTLLDVTNYSLGIEVEGRKFAKLIPKNTHIPTQRTQLVSTVSDDQQVVRIHILQGEAERAEDNKSLGEFELRGITAGRRGEPRIEVKFAIDSNGMVNVSARDARSGIAQDLSIHAPTSLSASEIEDLQAEAANRFEDDKTTADINKQRHQIHQSIRELQTLLDDHGDELDGQQVSEARQVVVLAKEVLDEDDVEAFDEALTQLRSYKSALS